MAIPGPAAVSINDMLDGCAKISPGQEVLILAYVDGLHGGDNLVDREAMAWIQTAVQMRGAKASVLWADERPTVHKWRFPPIVKAAMAASDLMINNTLDLSFEELIEFKQFTWTEKKLFVRNFATTVLPALHEVGADPVRTGERDPLPGGTAHRSGGGLATDGRQRHPLGGHNTTCV